MHVVLILDVFVNDTEFQVKFMFINRSENGLKHIFWIVF